MCVSERVSVCVCVCVGMCVCVVYMYTMYIALFMQKLIQNYQSQRSK